MIKIVGIDFKPITKIGQMAGLCYGTDVNDEEKNYNRGLHCVNSGHGRPLEYVTIELLIEGYSSRTIRQLYTHMNTTKMQESTRYMDCANFTYYIPENLTGEQKLKYIGAMEMIKELYKELKVAKVPKEDRANVLPLGMHSSVIFKTNLRQLIHIFEQRTCKRAYKEFRHMLNEVKKEILKQNDSEWEHIANHLLVPKCIKQGFCLEEYQCKEQIMPKKEDLEFIKK